MFPDRYYTEGVTGGRSTFLQTFLPRGDNGPMIKYQLSSLQAYGFAEKHEDEAIECAVFLTVIFLVFNLKNRG
jgi:hypothetical protein